MLYIFIYFFRYFNIIPFLIKYNNLKMAKLTSQPTKRYKGSSQVNFQFCPVQDWDKAVSPTTIMGGFKETSIYPFNPNTIPEEAFAPASVSENLSPIKNTAKVGKTISIQGTSSIRQVCHIPPSSSTPVSSQTVTVILHFLKITKMVSLFMNHRFKNYYHHHRKSAIMNVIKICNELSYSNFEKKKIPLSLSFIK